MNRLGKRLAALRDAITEDYDDIWDVCCDHGFLGESLLLLGRAKHLHLVDQLPVITKQLEERFNQYPEEQYSIDTCAGEELIVNKNRKTLVIISGVGGETVVDILSALAANNDLKGVDFLLSPANHAYELRAYLRQQHYGLINESVVFERRRGYELLLVKLNSSLQAVSEVGDIWNLKHQQHRKHLEGLLTHYRKRMKNTSQRARAKMIAEKYTQLFNEDVAV